MDHTQKPYVIPSLIHSGTRIINARYLILAERIGEETAGVDQSGPQLDVMLVEGYRFVLRGEDAEKCWRRLLEMTPPAAGGSAGGASSGPTSGAATGGMFADAAPDARLDPGQAVDR